MLGCSRSAQASRRNCRRNYRYLHAETLSKYFVETNAEVPDILCDLLYGLGCIFRQHFDEIRLNFALKYSILRVGAIAQLGERLHGMQEVGGSIPPGSTSFYVGDRSIFRPASPSSRGLGHHPFTVRTGVRIPVGTPLPYSPCQISLVISPDQASRCIYLSFTRIGIGGTSNSVQGRPRTSTAADEIARNYWKSRPEMDFPHPSTSIVIHGQPDSGGRTFGGILTTLSCVDCQQCGSSSSSRLARWVDRRSRTSLR